MQLKDIEDKYKELATKLLYDKTNDVLELISDEELEKLFSEYPEIFQQVTGDVKVVDLLNNFGLLSKVCTLFIDTIKNRKLSKDEFDDMTLDDVKDYLQKLIVTKDDVLYEFIHYLEHK